MGQIIISHSSVTRVSLEEYAWLVLTCILSVGWWVFLMSLNWFFNFQQNEVAAALAEAG